MVGVVVSASILAISIALVGCFAYHAAQVALNLQPAMVMCAMASGFFMIAMVCAVIKYSSKIKQAFKPTLIVAQPMPKPVSGQRGVCKKNLKTMTQKRNDLQEYSSRRHGLSCGVHE